MKKQLIRLTEEDLNQIIESTVHRIITENSEDEGKFDTLRSFFGQYKNRGEQKAKEMGKAAGKAIKSGYNTASQKVQDMGKDVGKAIKSGYGTASKKMQDMGKDINDTWKGAQRDGYMKDMRKAFNNFKMSVERYKQNGGVVDSQLGSRISGIENMLNSYQPNF